MCFTAHPDGVPWIMQEGDLVAPVNRRQTKTTLFRVKKVLDGGKIEISPEFGSPDIRSQVYTEDAAKYRPTIRHK